MRNPKLHNIQGVSFKQPSNLDKFSVKHFFIFCTVRRYAKNAAFIDGDVITFENNFFVDDFKCVSYI